MKKLSFIEKAGFSVGELAGSGLWQVVLIFLPIFYTDIFGLSAATVGTMFMIVRIFDAINDPIMGTIADRTQTRWGKFRPYLIWMSTPFGVLAFLLFFAPDFTAEAKVLYAYVSYISMMMVYTAVMIPYSALSGVMTSDYWDRTSLNSFRFIGAFAGAMMVQGLMLPAIKYFGQGTEITGYRWTMAIYGLACILFFWIAFISTKERIQPVSEKRNALLDDLKDLIQNKSWIVVLFVSLATLIYVSIRSAVQVYYFEYYIGNKELVSSFMVAGTASTIVAIVLTKSLAKKFDKKKLLILCNLIAGGTSLLFFFVRPTDIILLYTIQVVAAFAAGPLMPLIWSMMGDSADYSEWKTGRRATGLVFSASTFAFKAGGAIGGALSMYLLSFYGYVANAEQTAETLMGMRLMMSVWPAAGAFLCLLILLFYPLNVNLMQQITEDLETRKSAQQSVK